MVRAELCLGGGRTEPKTRYSAIVNVHHLTAAHGDRAVGSHGYLTAGEHMSAPSHREPDEYSADEPCGSFAADFDMEPTRPAR